MKYIDKVSNAKKLIAEACEKYAGRIAIGCSFGKDSMATLHMARSVDPNIPVFGIMASTEFMETFNFRTRIVKEWDLDYKEYMFHQEPGTNDNRALCCGKPKVEQTKLALLDYDAWISGVRKTEGITRSDFDYVEEKDGLVKFNPILDFTETDIWRYLAVNDIPTNPKYKEGYRSLGCMLCSAPEEDESESERAGRWKGTDKAMGECGIHTQSLR